MFSNSYSEIQSSEEIVDIMGKINVCDEVEDNTIHLKSVTYKKTLITSRTFRNFIMQFEKKTLRKVSHKLQLDIKFNKNKNNKITVH